MSLYPCVPGYDCDLLEISHATGGEHILSVPSPPTQPLQAQAWGARERQEASSQAGATSNRRPVIPGFPAHRRRWRCSPCGCCKCGVPPQDTHWLQSHQMSLGLYDSLCPFWSQSCSCQWAGAHRAALPLCSSGYSFGTGFHSRPCSPLTQGSQGGSEHRAVSPYSTEILWAAKAWDFGGKRRVSG